MIKANELRIGNYVTLCQINDEYIEFDMPVSSIHSDNTIRLLNNRGEIGCFGLRQCKSIPLTEEWLLKFGFTKEANGWHKKDICNDFSALYWERLAGLDLSVNKRSMHLSNIEYVHQLQNLYFALTGQELQLTNSN